MSRRDIGIVMANLDMSAKKKVYKKRNSDGKPGHECKEEGI